MPNPFRRLIMLLAANDTKKTTGSLQTIFNEVTLLKIHMKKKNCTESLLVSFLILVFASARVKFVIVSTKKNI